MANANGKRKSRGNRRSSNELECVDMNEGWSEQVRNPTRCLHFSNLPSPWHPHTPLRCKTCASVLNPYACVIFATKPVFVFVLDTCMIEEEMGYVKSALRRTVCHWLVARERPCWLLFIWDSDSSSWIGLLRHVQGFDFSGKGNDKVRGTTSFPLLFF